VAWWQDTGMPGVMCKICKIELLANTEQMHKHIETHEETGIILIDMQNLSRSPSKCASFFSYYTYVLENVD
jgi:hypothetical protein